LTPYRAGALTLKASSQFSVLSSQQTCRLTTKRRQLGTSMTVSDRVLSIDRW